MRLLIALPDLTLARDIQTEMENRLWDAKIVSNGQELLGHAKAFDILLVHRCLPGGGGHMACERLAKSSAINLPKILYLCPPEMIRSRPSWADCTAETGVSILRLCDLVELLGKKPLSCITAARHDSIARMTETFLDEIGMKPHFKGRAYASWLLQRMIPSPLYASEPLNVCYAACAQAFGVSPLSVERCLRVAVENVFTRGNMYGIDRYFGATVDPERGKPTNRAFLLQAAQQLRFTPSR